MNYLNIPGLHNSDEAHWQTRWEKLFPASFTRVEQENWERPLKDEWVKKLDEEIQRLEVPTILVAHSLGCITAVHWSSEYTSRFVAGMLLVAPADVENKPGHIFKSFVPVPLTPVSIPSMVVASMNDPYCTIERAAKWAAYWKARFAGVGNKGHINSHSNLNYWEEGLSLLRELEYTIGTKEYRSPALAGKG